MTRTFKVVMAAAAAAAVLAMSGCQVEVGSEGQGDGAKPGATADPGAGAADATAQLDELSVAKAGSMSGYSREKFPHWRDTGKNCDMRDTILQRDGEDVKLDGCNVTDGRWYSVYDGQTYDDPGKVDIDHMVPPGSSPYLAVEAGQDSIELLLNDLGAPVEIPSPDETSRIAISDFMAVFEGQPQCGPAREDMWASSGAAAGSGS